MRRAFAALLLALSTVAAVALFSLRPAPGAAFKKVRAFVTWLELKGAWL